MKKKRAKDRDETKRKIDAAVERLGVMSSARDKAKSNRVAKRLGMGRGEIFGLGLGEFDE
jgi:hypothetical protein